MARVFACGGALVNVPFFSHLCSRLVTVKGNRRRIDPHGVVQHASDLREAGMP